MTYRGTVRFAHVNLIARDWRALATFYCEVFGCEVVPPERDLDQDWLGAGAGIPGATLRGAHLRLPGYEPGAGPTLEIFQYNANVEREPGPANTTGYGHIAFGVDDVAAMAAEVIAHGGSELGERVDVEVSGAGPIVWQYVRDPEGNIIELQRWS